jgi:flagellar protein FliJ
MNNKLRRIDPLIRRAEERREAVAREFAARNKQLAQQEQRLGELLRYVDEYAQWPAGASLAPAQLANREAFRGKLGEAVEAQRQYVEACRSQAELERVRLTLASRESKVIEKLADSYREEARLHGQRIEQKELDEFAVGRDARPTPPQEPTP